MAVSKIDWKFCHDHPNERCYIKTGTSDGSSKGKSFYVCGVKGCKFRELLVIPAEMCAVHQDFMVELQQLLERDGETKIAFRCKCPTKESLSWCGFISCIEELENSDEVQEEVHEEEEEEFDQDSENSSDSANILSSSSAIEEIQPSPIAKSGSVAKSSARVSDSEDDIEELSSESRPRVHVSDSRSMSQTPSVVEDSFIENEEVDSSRKFTPDRRNPNVSSSDRSRSELVRKTQPVRLSSGGAPPPSLDFAELAKVWDKRLTLIDKKRHDFASESFSSPRKPDPISLDSSSESENLDEDDGNELGATVTKPAIDTSPVVESFQPEIVELSDDEDGQVPQMRTFTENINSASASNGEPRVARTLAELNAQIAALAQKIKVSKNLMARGLDLPDGGKRMRDSQFKWSQEISLLEEKRQKIISSGAGHSLKEHNEEDPQSPPNYPASGPKKVSPKKPFIPPTTSLRITEAERLFGGRMNDARWREARAVTAEAIERLHGSLQSCPPEEQETPDPRGLVVPLMPHQRKALTWLIWRESQHPCGGVLADEMGLGKTLTMISLALKQKQNDQKFTFEKLDRDVIVTNSTLIICPASLMGQWENEIKNRVDYGKLKVLLFHGPKRDTDPRVLARYDVVISTYKTVASELGPEIAIEDDDNDENDGKMFTKFKTGHKKNTKNLDSEEDDALFSKKRMPKAWSSGKSVLIRVAWQRLILDEGHNIKNHTAITSQACCKLISGARWVVTGTPIHNKLLEFYSLLKFLRCSPFDELPVWKNWIEPATKNDRADKRLKTLVDCILLRRTKAQIDPSTGRAIVDLPSKTSEVIHLTLNPAEKRIYDRMFQHSKKVVANFIKKQEEKDNEMMMVSTGVASREQFGYRSNPFRKGAQINESDQGSRTNQVDILVMLLRLRQACAHLHLMESSVNMEQLKNEGELDLDLEQKFDDLNLNDAKDERRKDPSVEELFRIDYLSTKVRAVMDRLKEIHRLSGDGPIQKCIIVSQWVGFLNVVELHLERKGIQYTSITGQVPICDRTERMEKFNRPGGPTIMLLSLTAGGVGLNLIGANHLILVDLHWNPALELQASDRIHRMGQKRDVVIHKFVCKDTIEERILELQTNKLKLANGILSGAGAKGLNKLSLSDLKMLFDLGAGGTGQRGNFADIATGKI